MISMNVCLPEQSILFSECIFACRRTDGVTGGREGTDGVEVRLQGDGSSLATLLYSGLVFKEQDD